MVAVGSGEGRADDHGSNDVLHNADDVRLVVAGNGDV